MRMMRYKDSYWQDAAGGERTYILKDQGTRIMGLSANLEYMSWIIKSEIDRFEQPEINFIYNYALLGVGHTFGDFTPMYTRLQYTTAADPIEARKTEYFSLRWNFCRGG